MERFIVLLLLFSSCTSFHNKGNHNLLLVKRDSLKNEMQNSIVDFKKFTAVNFYNRLLYKSYENAGLEKTEDWSGSFIFKYSKGFLFTQTYVTDKNQEKLINKWLNKNYFDNIMMFEYDLMNEKDKKKITLDILKFIDFYQSSDLNNYMDSIKEIELKKINDGVYDNQ